MRIAAALLSVGLCLVVAGCGGKAKESGFLKNYEQLKPDEAVDGALRYVNPKAFTYRQFMIDPVAVHFAPDAKGATIDPEKLTELTTHFRDGLTKALAKNYKVVKSKGPGVMRIRVAITDVELTIAALNILPTTKITGAGLGGASMEGEVLDSESGERLGAIVETRSGNRFSVGAGLSELGNAKQVIDYWIERFVGNLDKAQGKGK
jgi:hypothetical protein